MTSAYPFPAADRRLPGVLLTVLVHLALILLWQTARQLPRPQIDPVRTSVQWIWLPAPVPTPRIPVPAPTRAAIKAVPPPSRVPAATTQSAPPAPAIAERAPSSAATPAAQPAAATAPLPAPAASAAPSAEQILQRARRDIGSIDKALRKENNAVIVAPPDSPQIRLRKGIEEAHDLAPPRLWEAPKIEELVNDTGNGERRTRVISGGGTYCITERSPAGGIDMFEKHGRQKITSCPPHEQTAKKQEWRTARD